MLIKQRQIYFFIASMIVMVAPSSFAKAPKKTLKADIKTYPLLEETTKRYRTSPMISMELEKTVKESVMGSVRKSSGSIDLAAGLFRMEIREPDKSLTVFDGKILWNEQSPPVEFPGPVQVSKLAIDKKNDAQVLLADLLTKDKVSKNFRVIGQEKVNDVVIYRAEPLKKDFPFQSVAISILGKSKVISEISYEDDLQNITTMAFSKTQFKDQINKKTFSYKPPKGAQVNEK